MHDTTKQELGKIAGWTAALVQADHYATKLEDALPGEDSNDSYVYHAIDNHLGDLALRINQADGADDAKPYLRAAREAGFRREDGPRTSAHGGTVTWYYRTEDGVALTVTLYLSTAEGASCQYVQVGTKVVPDVQLLCGDQLKKWNEDKS